MWRVLKATLDIPTLFADQKIPGTVRAEFKIRRK